MVFLKKFMRHALGPSSDPSGPSMSETQDTQNGTTHDGKPVRSSAATATLTTSMAILKEIGEVTAHFPFIKGAAGVLLRVLEINDGIEVYRDRWREVIENVQQAAELVISIYKKFQYPACELPTDIQHILESLERDLEEVEASLLQCRRKPAWQRFKFNIHRSEMIKRIDLHDRKIRSIVKTYNTSLVINIHNSQHFDSQVTSIHELNIHVPAKPHIFYGREKQVNMIVTSITKNIVSPARIVLLGSGGIGKTTLALAVLHHPAVKNHFKDEIYFISCDACTSVAMVISNMAKVLKIEAEPGQPLDQRVLLHLQTISCILCLDNFETPWDQDVDRKISIEGFLAKITSLPSVTLLLTMRGIERPAGMDWTKPVLSPLQPFDFLTAKQIFEHIASRWDKWAEKLINAVEGLPLAITLLGHLAQSLECKYLWQQWEQKNISSLNRHRGHRLTSVEVSIQLSIEGSRMKASPSSLVLLQILSILPAGLPLNKIQEFQVLFSDISDLMQSTVPLQQTSLAFILNDRLNTHSMIRYYCQKHLPLNSVQMLALEHYYVHMMIQTGVTHDKLQEYPNIGSVLLKSIQCDMLKWQEESILKAILLYTTFVSHEFGILAEELFDMLDKHKKDMPLEYIPQYLYHWGSCLYIAGNIVAAEKKYIEALRYAKDKSDGYCKAEALHGLGCIYSARYDFDLAVSYFEQALSIHKEIEELEGQAKDLSALANAYVGLYNLEQAQEHAQKSLNLYTSLNDNCGQGKAWQYIGDCLNMKGQYDIACECFHKAVNNFTVANTRIGLANALKSIGSIYTIQKKYILAKEYLYKALKVEKETKEILFEADTLDDLGNLYYELHDYDKAFDYYEKALKIQIEIDDTLRQGASLTGLGAVCAAKCLYEDAIQYLKKAVDIHEQCNQPSYTGHDLATLAMVYFDNSQFQLSSEAYSKAIDMYKEINDLPVLSFCLMATGWVDVKLNQFTLAEKHYKESLYLCEKNNLTKTKPNILLSIGDLYKRTDREKDAIDYYCQAGEIYSKLDDSDDCNNTLKRIKKLTECNK